MRNSRQGINIATRASGHPSQRKAADRIGDFCFIYRARTGSRYRARYYDPRRARFIQEDPFRLATTVNPYLYVLNSPLGLTDPLGLVPAAALKFAVETNAKVGLALSVLDVVAAPIGLVESGFKIAAMSRAAANREGWAAVNGLFCAAAADLSALAVEDLKKGIALNFMGSVGTIAAAGAASNATGVVGILGAGAGTLVTSSAAATSSTILGGLALGYGVGTWLYIHYDLDYSKYIYDYFLADNSARPLGGRKR